MELYILDSLLRRTAVIDLYESLIWTERYSSSGDFELQTLASNDSSNLLVAGTRLAQNQSNRVMTIESIENKDDSEGRSLLIVKGPSLEDVLTDRTAKGPAAQTVDDKGVVTTSLVGKWRMTDTPGNIARAIVKAICQTGILSENDKIPYLTDGTLYPADTIPEIAVPVTLDMPIDDLYTTLKNICDSYNLGFRLTRNLDASQLYFNVYTGIDRTTKQTAYTPVIFSRAFGNVQDITYLKAITDYKNTAYVYNKNGFEVVYASGATNVSGLERRVLTLTADDIDLPAGTALSTALQKRGQEELAKAKNLSALDGQISQYSTYKYGTDYNLGDIIEMRNSDGITSDMKVTEQIFVSDTEGDRSYPTLTTDLFINPGSWFSSIGAKTWTDAPGTWNDQAV